MVRWVEAGAKKVEVEASQVIVDKTTEHSKEAHHCEHIAKLAQYFQEPSLQFVVLGDSVESEGKNHQSVGNISEHYAEEKGKSNSGEDARIYLPVTRDPICVCDLLGNRSVGVCFKCRGGQLERCFVHGRSGHNPIYQEANSFYLFLWYVRIGNIELLPPVQSIQVLIQYFFLP